VLNQEMIMVYVNERCLVCEHLSQADICDFDSGSISDNIENCITDHRFSRKKEL
jgi:hypothetical protein